MVENFWVAENSGEGRLVIVWKDLWGSFVDHNIKNVMPNHAGFEIMTFRLQS